MSHQHARDGHRDSGSAAGGRKSSVAAVALAFLASQHHNFMMLLLALGLGGAAMRFMKVAPLVRDAMLGMSLAMIAVIAYQIRDSGRPRSTRVVGVISILVTLGLSVWSLTRSGS